MRFQRVGALGALFLVGCGLAAVDPDESGIAVNRCSDDGDCREGRCSNGMCVAREGTLATLLFEVVPTASAERFAGVTLRQVSDQVPLGSGEGLDLVLDDLSSVVGSVLVENVAGAQPELASFPSGCKFRGEQESLVVGKAADGTIPVRATFSLSRRTLGLGDVPRVASVDTSSSDARNTVGASPSSPPTHTFEIELPAGVYDIYVEPRALQLPDPPAPESQEPAPECLTPSNRLPPQLIRGQRLEGGSVSLDLELARQRVLELQIVVAGEPSIDYWTVDMLEPLTGRVVSTRAELGVGPLTGTYDPVLDSSTYRVSLTYLPVIGTDPGDEGEELVRISPPEGAIEPTILLERTALELFNEGAGVIDQLPGTHSPVRFGGWVQDGGSGLPRKATLTAVATQLRSIPAGTFASFTRRAETDDAGHFDLNLLPGTYRVYAQPLSASDRSPEVSSVEVVWEVTDSAVQDGRVVELPTAATLSGRAVTPGAGDGVLGALVSAEVSPLTVAPGVLDRALGAAPPVPRSAATVVQEESGSFKLPTEFGTFDFSVRPPEASNLAWMVMPGLLVPENAPVPLELGFLRLPLPVRMEGSVRIQGRADSSALLTGALVRAYALLDEEGKLTLDPDRGSAAVPVAEARLGSSGDFVLQVPASLNERVAP